MLSRFAPKSVSRALTASWIRCFWKSMAFDSNSIFYISLPDKPVYLERWKGKADVGNDRKAVLKTFRTLYIIDPPPHQSPDEAREILSRDELYVRSCLATQSLFRELVEQDLSSFEFLLGAKKEQKETSLGRQLYALLADDAKPTADDSLRSLTQKRHCPVWIYEKDETTTDSCLLWRMRDCQVNGITAEKRELMPEVLTESVHQPEVSPILGETTFSPVFRDYERAVKVLQMNKDCAEVQELFKIAAQELGERKTLKQLEAMMKHPLVVVEGMDATGKTTLTQFLEDKLQAARYSTPPPCFLPLRRFFDKLPEIVRRAYYSLGNYIVAQQIASECQTRAVVMDRYWHSTAAYGIANETSYDDLPPPGHHDYCWPSDLLKPTAVIFLTVSEAVRRERLGNRQESSITFEERNLNKDQLFRKRLCESYLRMQEPPCIQVDASGSKEEVVDAVLRQLQLQGIQLN